jgi:uncharacterized protein (DUF302 family)
MKLRTVATTILAFSVAISLGAQAKQGAIYFNTDGSKLPAFYQLVDKGIKPIGFSVTDPHKKINDAYKEKYGSTVMTTLDFFPIVHEAKLKALLEKEPRLAGFNPFDLYSYQRKNEKTLHVGHLTPETILDILKIQDKDLRSAYTATFADLDKQIQKTLGGTTTTVEYDALPEDTMMNFEITVPRDKDLGDWIDDFQEKFEEVFEEKKYIIAGFWNFKEAYEETPDKFATYDAFWTYSLCHFTFSYNMFDHKNGRPEAGIFAPCTMYMYIKKGSNKLVIGMPKLANWQAVNSIKDPKKIELIKGLDKEIPSIMREALGAQEFASDFGSKGK